MKKAGLPRDTRPGVRGKKRDYVNFRVYPVESLLGPGYTPSPPSLRGRGGHPPRSCGRWICNVSDLMHSRNKLYCRVACVAVRIAATLCRVTKPSTQHRSAGVARSRPELASRCYRDVARQWKRPFAVILPYRSY